jgi:hypothetical protein
MPDFVNNFLALTHSNRSKLEEALTAYTNGELLYYFVPVPENGDNSEYWGTRSDIYYYEEDEELDPDNDTLYLTFATAYDPPFQAYYAAVELHGFQVTGSFYSPSKFCGVIIPNERELRLYYRKGDEIPEDIDEWFCIKERWEEDGEENDDIEDYYYDHSIQFWTRDIAPPYELKDFSTYLTAWLKNEPIGQINPDGYRVINIEGRDYYMHDLVYAYIRGRWPNREVEHINGNKDDNRWANLKLKDAPIPGHLRSAAPPSLLGS